MKTLTQIFVVTLFSAVIFVSFAQDKPETEKKNEHMHMDMKHMQSDSTMHHGMKTDSIETQAIVRKGEIDLKVIDKNDDGKVFQDMMDWNVISDEPGNCPLCGMTLKEYTLEKVKENLVKHGFKVKEK